MNILEDIKKDKLIQKYMYKYTWISGESTTVYPIMVYRCKSYIIDITIQIDTKRNYFKKLIERYMNKYKNIEYAYFSKTDNSCPSYLYFKLKEE